jgi:hypothetical protein
MTTRFDSLESQWSYHTKIAQIDLPCGFLAFYNYDGLWGSERRSHVTASLHKSSGADAREQRSNPLPLYSDNDAMRMQTLQATARVGCCAGASGTSRIVL